MEGGSGKHEREGNQAGKKPLEGIGCVRVIAYGGCTSQGQNIIAAVDSRGKFEFVRGSYHLQPLSVWLLRDLFFLDRTFDIFLVAHKRYPPRSTMVKVGGPRKRLSV
jgi:hypothetical protein